MIKLFKGRRQEDSNFSDKGCGIERQQDAKSCWIFKFGKNVFKIQRTTLDEQIDEALRNHKKTCERWDTGFDSLENTIEEIKELAALARTASQPVKN